MDEVEVSSLHPHHPGVKHVLDEMEDEVKAALEVETTGLDVGNAEAVGGVGAGSGDGLVMVVVCVVVCSSLQPNQPGVRHVVVVMVLVMVVVVVVDVLSSRQPHQPGVLHVSVLVRVDDVEAAEDEVFVVSVPLDS